MKVLAIIVSYNFDPWLDLCLGSLRRSEHPVSVFVADNGSTDQTVSRILLYYPEVTLEQNLTNKGFGSANNQGFAYAIRENFDYVFLINQDAYIAKDTIGNLVEHAKKNKDFGILSPVHLNGKGDDFDLGFRAYSGLKSLRDIPLHGLTECSFINAALWLIPVPVLKIIGGFAPVFLHYGEDGDYVNRIKYRGLKTGYAGNALGYHCRENRPVSREKFLYAEYVYFLTEAVNPNYSLPEAFAFSILAAVKKSLTACLKPDRKTGFEYLKMARKLLRQTGVVMKTRRSSRREEGAFLYSKENLNTSSL